MTPSKLNKIREADEWEKRFDAEIGCEPAAYFASYRDEMIDRIKAFIRAEKEKTARECNEIYEVATDKFAQKISKEYEKQIEEARGDKLRGDENIFSFERLKDFCADEERASLNDLNEWDLRMLWEFIARENNIARAAERQKVLDEVREKIEKLPKSSDSGSGKHYEYHEIPTAVFKETLFEILASLQQPTNNQNEK